MTISRTVFLFLTFFAAFYGAEFGSDEEFQCPPEYHLLINKEATVSSPFYGKENEYRTDLSCKYRLTAPEGYSIKIDFKDFDINPSEFCEMDKLRLYINEIPALSLCGSQIPHPIFLTTNEVVFSFETNYQFSRGRRGFLLHVVATLNETMCDEGFSQCGNRKCYHNEKKCDGMDDCGDGSDEEECGEQIPHGTFECGNTPFAPDTTFSSADRMVGGRVARPHSWPWQVSLRLKTHSHSHFCGGTLINDQWVLTAAHCFISISDPFYVAIHLGSHNKREESSFHQMRNAVKIISYPNLEGKEMENYDTHHDMTLIKLNAPVKFTDGVQPACLPGQGWELPEGTACYTTGWGETRGTGSNVLLKQTKQVVVSEQDCDTDDINTESQICVENVGNTPCKGDSGGPLVCKIENKWYIFGATSRATRDNQETALCATPGISTIFSKVSDKVDWIKAMIQRFS
ncbi:plasminogen-like [Uloborus diversus]|uniref:plasminogen-like n=1 Tax=Uloborus diversus TaxID=327109 RepID=UPI00240A34F6|nr:plasminogen-like [Uloborus diversus]